jgi:hypothetical protein
VGARKVKQKVKNKKSKKQKAKRAKSKKQKEQKVKSKDSFFNSRTALSY